MNERTPEFSELVGEDVSPEESARASSTCTG